MNNTYKLKVAEIQIISDCISYTVNIILLFTITILQRSKDHKRMLGINRKSGRRHIDDYQKYTLGIPHSHTNY